MGFSDKDEELKAKLKKDMYDGIDVMENLKKRLENPTMLDNLRYILRKIIPFKIRNKYFRSL